jgi:hypothetical protein
MDKPIIMNIKGIVGSEFCVASDDGQKIYEMITKALNGGRKVVLSFLNVESLTSAFLNTAIGQLYGSFSKDEIKKSLLVKNISPEDRMLLKRVVETAKEYYKNPKQFEEQNREAMEDNDVA